MNGEIETPSSSISISSTDDSIKKIAIITEIGTTIQEVRDLPTLPSIAFEVLRVARKPNSRVPEMTQVMEVDVASMGKVLRIANSTYSVPRKIDSLRMVLGVIGREEISNLVATASIIKAFGSNEDSDD